MTDSVVGFSSQEKKAGRALHPTSLSTVIRGGISDESLGAFYPTLSFYPKDNSRHRLDGLCHRGLVYVLATGKLHSQQGGPHTARARRGSACDAEREVWPSRVPDRHQRIRSVARREPRSARCGQKGGFPMGDLRLSAFPSRS